MNEKKVEPVAFTSKRGGLKIHVRPDTQLWDERSRTYVRNPGLIIKFNDGRFVATTEEEIAALEAYSKKHPNDVFSVAVGRQRLIEALQEAEKEEKKKIKEETKKMRGGQGAASSSPIKE